MKLFSILTGSIITATVLVVASCAKEAETTQVGEIRDLSNKSLVQVYNAIVTSPGSHITVDNAQVNGTASTAAVGYGSAFPTGSFFMVEPGLRLFNVRPSVATSLQTPLTFPETFNAGARYSVFLYDTLNAAKQLTVLSNIEIPSDTSARLRFANFAYFPGGAPAIDIYSVKKKANVATNVTYTQVTPYNPHPAAVTDSFIVRSNATPVVALDTLIFTPTRKRSYTLLFRGRYRTNEAGGAASPRVLSAIANY